MEGLTGGERGFLLLTSTLGDPDRKPLTVPQFRELTRRYPLLDRKNEERELTLRDLANMGYGADFSGHILKLLEQESALEAYLRQGKRLGCVPVTRASDRYPLLVRQRLGWDSPGVLWAKGDLDLLARPAVSLVGSRELRPENRIFAEEAGKQAADRGLVLVSGNARGADKAAQNACLKAGGSVISIVADALADHVLREGCLYLSENAFDEGFSAQRALSRNRIIHTLGRMVFVAQADLHRGGTWDGTVKNLRNGWSSVVCFRDGSEASLELEQMGAWLMGLEELPELTDLGEAQYSFFDR